jgi:hypothetical protein
VKGAVYGGLAWITLLGVMQNMGATNTSPGRPKTNMMELFSHVGYGVVTASVIRRLGDESLFVDSTDETTVEDYAIRRSQMLYSKPVSNQGDDQQRKDEQQ